MNKNVTPKVVQAEATRQGHLPTYLQVILVVLTSIGVILSVLFIFHIGGVRGVFSHYTYFYTLITVFLSISFLILPARKKDRTKVPWYDLVAASLVFGVGLYFTLNSWNILLIGWGRPSLLNFLLACFMLLAVLEGARRTGGLIFFGIATVLTFFPLFADAMPGIMRGVSWSLNHTVGLHVFGSEGLLGVPSRVMGGYIFGFLVFAGVMIASGAGQFFMQLALGLLGKKRGGPAKVAVIGSAFFGSLSGSALSNIAGTGAFTIPLMKRLGYPAHYAGAIEACASTGGVLLPPVMGAVAFVMAVMLGVPYVTIMVVAIVPSVLFYYGLLLQIDLYAAKHGLSGLPKEELPSLWATLKEGWPFLFVIAFLIWGLGFMWWEAQAPYYASLVMVLLSFTSRETMMTPKKIFETIATIGRLVAQTQAVLLPIGLIIVGLGATGVSARLTGAAIGLAGDNVILLLIIGALTCYLLGMTGMLAPAYIFLAVTLAPALITAGGLNPLAVHFFIAYYAMLSLITPPVALGAFLAATLADAPNMKTAFTCMRLGIVLLIIPFFFVYNPALVLQGGSIFETLYLFIQCLLGIALISAGFEGYLWKVGNLVWLARPLLVVGGFLIAFPNLNSTLIGLLFLPFAALITFVIRKYKAKPSTEAQL